MSIPHSPIFLSLTHSQHRLRRLESLAPPPAPKGQPISQLPPPGLDVHADAETWFWSELLDFTLMLPWKIGMLPWNTRVFCNISWALRLFLAVETSPKWGIVPKLVGLTIKHGGRLNGQTTWKPFLDERSWWAEARGTSHIGILALNLIPCCESPSGAPWPRNCDLLVNIAPMSLWVMIDYDYSCGF